MLLVLLLGLELACSTEAVAVTYFVANNGADGNDGTTEETAWRSIARLNLERFAPGDAILFRRGDTWREQLIPSSGSEDGHVTYGAYGTGPKPLLLGSVEKNRSDDWRDEGGNIWSTVQPETVVADSSQPSSNAGNKKHSHHRDEKGAPVKVSGEHAETGALICDVGNIIFDGGTQCGVKVWSESDLDIQGEYWYDAEHFRVMMYSAQSPASSYTDIECALMAHIVDETNKSYIIYENLDLRYGAAHGIGGSNTHHIIVRDCDLSFIGGGNQYGNDRHVRYGNGVEFWATAHDNLVERCRLWEIYDAALTNQNNAPHVEQYNIAYRNNVIWNCEYSFEYWNRPDNSRTRNIAFENNTCVNAGHGWGHTQRPDPSGRHLCFYASPAQAKEISIRNNIFFEAKGNAFYAPTWPQSALAALLVDHNCWFQAAGIMIRLKDKSYPMARFSAYQFEQQKGANSIVGNPLFVDSAKADFRLKEGSPCIDAGADVEREVDHAGTPVPAGSAPDIGAYEFRSRRF